MNAFKTALLLTVLTVLLIALGGAIGGNRGMMFAFMFACVMNFGAYWFSDKIVLAMYSARPIQEQDAPALFKMVSDLTRNAGLPMPKIYRIPTQTPNAFATGRDPHHAVIAVTDGILELLDEQELRGVLAHELAHVEHRDILISSIAATIAGAISMLASMARWSAIYGRSGRQTERGQSPLGILIMAMVAPFAAMLVQLAVSRSREFHADERGASLCGNPLQLAGALRKLDAGVKRFPMIGANPATAHLFIVNPLRSGAMATLFSTHPPLEERVVRLERMAR